MRKGERVREKELAAPLLSPPESIRPSLPWRFAAGVGFRSRSGAGHSASKGVQVSTNQQGGSASETRKQEEQARGAFCFDRFQNLRPLF